MSLINDMLKDLDTQRVRRSVANAAALPGYGLAGDIGTATQKSLAIVIAVSLMILLGVFAWPYTTDIFARNSRTITTENTVRDTREQLSASKPAVQEAAARPLPARAPRTASKPDNIVHASEEAIPEKTKTVGKQYMETPKPAVQTVKQTARSSAIVTRPLSPQERVQRNYQQAVHALRAGKPADAEQLLARALTLDSNHHKTRLLLASVYIRQQRSIDAESLLASGLAQYPGHSPYAKLYAQLMVVQARYREAIQHLQTALPGAGQDADYHAILAGLYQRTGKAPEAAQHYQLALRITPAKGEWWMGLGISLEQSGNPEKSFAAYQRALQLPLSIPLQQYVNTRIRNLPRQQGQD